MSALRFLTAAGVGALVMWAPSSSAQIPDKFTNLKVLPEGIAKADLVATMRDWAGGLGVRCAHCHAGPDNLKGMDFASDDKRTKRVAREMLRMSRSIGEVMRSLPPGEQPSQAVSCYTCHRGLSMPPRDLVGELAGLATREGSARAVERYRELRTAELENGRYDFSARALGALTGRLLEGEQLDAARAFAVLNIEFHPESADAYASLGRVALAAGDRARARAAFEEALQRDPHNPAALHALQGLQEHAEAPPR
jgi:Photosynthetic reaction centre cytochrome C subunit/Tetratricopeptide repeat